MHLAISSFFSVLPHTTVCLENNHAHLGGAIYVYDVNPSIYCTDIEQFILKKVLLSTLRAWSESVRSPAGFEKQFC